MPGERWDTGRGSPDFVRGLCQGVRCRSKNTAAHDASIAGSGATQPQIHQKRWAPLGQRSPVAARPTDHLPWTLGPQLATMTKGRRRLKNALIITCSHRLPRRPGQRRSLFRPWSLCEHASKGIDETCVCDYGFSGPIVLLRLCPAARAWSDYASANNTAHARHVECAKYGGLRPGYRRVCVSVGTGFRQATRASVATGSRDVSDGHTHRKSTEGVLWLRKMYQYEGRRSGREIGCRYIERVLSMTTGTRTCCLCLRCGFQGWDCLQRICPKGDDPLTPGLDEVQLVECTCLEAGGCANNIVLNFQGPANRSDTRGCDR